MKKDKKINRNDPCWCGEDKKYKQCHIDHDEQLKLIRKRMKYDAGRYKQLYDIDIESKSPYTCIIESDNLNPDQVLNAALVHLEAYK